MRCSKVLSTTLLVSAAVATPVIVPQSPITLALSRHVNTSSVHNLARHDQARVKMLRSTQSTTKSSNFSQSEAETVNVPSDNQAVTYVATVNIGTPPAPYSLIIDTGSSNTWIGANSPYSSSTMQRGLNVVNVEYGSGKFIGTEVTDVVQLAPGLSIKNQSIGYALATKGFSGVDGILGLGPTGLTVGTLLPSSNSAITTVVDNLFFQGTIPSHGVGIYFEATNSDQGLSNGEMTFGGTDVSKYDSITYTPTTTTMPAGRYWGIDQSIKYGNITLLPPGSSGIVDTGTTLILIASDAYQTYVKTTGAVMDKNIGLLSLPLDRYSGLVDMIFVIGETEFRLIPDAQIWPRALNTDIGGVTDAVYLIIGDIGVTSGSGLDFVNGFSFLERFYSVFDTGNQRVGIATTAVTGSIVNF